MPQTTDQAELPADSISRCAIGAALDTRGHPSLPVPLSEFFAKRAKVLLELELDAPQVATVQGLAILSSHEAGFMRDTRAWLFSGELPCLSFDSDLAFGDVR